MDRQSYWVPGMSNDNQIVCIRRGLFIRPERDCRHCVWYECGMHPRHIYWPAIRTTLTKCTTRKRSRPDCKGKKKVWDGTQKHCARFNTLQKGKYGEHPCMNCTLNRPCKFRGEHGQWLLDRYTKEERRCIVRTGNRFRVRIQDNGRQINVGAYGTIEEARVARDSAELKRDGENADRGEHDTNT